MQMYINIQRTTAYHMVANLWASLSAFSCQFMALFICPHLPKFTFIICSLQNSSYCLLSTISGIFTINALLQQPCVPFHFDKQASFATSTPTNFCLQNHKCFFTPGKRFYGLRLSRSPLLIGNLDHRAYQQ